MDQVILHKYSNLYLEEGYWRLSWREDALDSHGLGLGHSSEPVVIGPSRAVTPTGLTETDAQWIAWNDLLSVMLRNASAQQSRMTVASFVERRFVPEHVARMMPSSQRHYLSMLKHVLRPEDVDHAFRAVSKRPKLRPAGCLDWPYIGQLGLCDVGPEHIARVTDAAVEAGYSAQTVSHIRNVMSAIFAYAIREQCFMGNNPVKLLQTAKARSTKEHALTLSQAKDALASMRHPEKELMLMAVLTDISMAELCGLQWKQVNLTERTTKKGGDPIPPRTIAIRKQWYRDTLENVKSNRVSDVAISEALHRVLGSLKERGRFTRPDDFVFASRQGTPVNPNNIVERRLKPLAARMGLPSISWQVFRRTRKALVAESEGLGQGLCIELVGFAYPTAGARPISRARLGYRRQSEPQPPSPKRRSEMRTEVIFQAAKPHGDFYPTFLSKEAN